MKISLLYVVSTLNHTGPVNQLYYLIKHLDKDIFSPHILTLSPEPEYSRWNDFCDLGVDLRAVGLSRIEGFLKAKRVVSNLILKLKPNIVHTHGFRADTILSDIEQTVPWVMTSRNYPIDDYKMKFGVLKGCYMANRHFKAMRRCKHVVACSKTIANLLSKHGVKATPIQNGVLLPSDTMLKSGEPLTFTKPVFVSVGSLIQRKNMEFLIKAFNEYGKSKKGTLLILGDGVERDKLEALSETKNIHFAGNVSDVYRYLSFADYFISSSFSEGLPNTVLEAIASGLPVILSDIPSHKEIAEDAGDVCHLFGLDRGEKNLANVLENTSDLFSPNVSDLARNTAENKFSAQTMSKNYQNYYKKILEMI